VQQLKNASGFSYDDDEGCAAVDDDVWEGWVKVRRLLHVLWLCADILSVHKTHKNAGPFRNKGWALYDDAASLFDKVSANGERAHRPGLRGVAALTRADDEDTDDDAPGRDVGGTDKEDIDENEKGDGNDDADSNEDGGSIEPEGEVVPVDAAAVIDEVAVAPGPNRTEAETKAKLTVTTPKPSSKAAGKRRRSHSPSITPDTLNAPKTGKKSKKNPNLVVLEELIDQFGTMNGQLQLANAIDLQNSRQAQAIAPQHSTNPSPNLPVILSPRSARREEAFAVLGKKDASHFNPDEIVLLCELFEDKTHAATYIAMSKTLPDDARRRWLQRKLYGPSDPVGMAMHLTAIEQYGSPGSPSVGSASFDGDVFAPMTSTADL